MTSQERKHLVRSLARADLPARFERWRVELPAGAARPTDAAEWAGALVLVEAGLLEVECGRGGNRTFAEGDLLALGWLPLKTLRNVGTGEVRLLAVRRRGPPPKSPFLRVFRRQDPRSADEFARK